MLSQDFRNALKIFPVPKYKLAWELGISPSTFYHLIHEHIYVKKEDERILKIARRIDFPEDKIFVENTQGNSK